MPGWGELGWWRRIALPSRDPFPLDNCPCGNCVTVLTSMDKRCAELWQKLSAALKPQVSSDTFKRWFAALELISADENELTFRVPNNIYKYWIESNHMAALQNAIAGALGAPRAVKFLSPSEPLSEPISQETSAAEVTDSARGTRSATST